LRILIVDDEPGIRQSLSGCWTTKAFSVDSVRAASDCLEALADALYEVVLLDIWLPGIDGLATLDRIQKMPAADRPVVVMISGHGTIDTAVRATKLGAYDFLEKPLSIERVLLVVKNAIEHRRCASRTSSCGNRPPGSRTSWATACP
jgi:two-component system nitrogen regulation response regulator NtrX